MVDCRRKNMTDQLSAKDWLDQGLRRLATSGFTALKAEPLAKALGISRGSFYWHFADIGAFHAAVLDRWQEVMAEAVIRELDRSAPGGERLRSLLRRAYTAKAALEMAALEMAVRAWAVSDAAARSRVAAVDRRRLAYLEDLLAATGIGAASAVARARIFYWAYLGFALSRPKLAREQLETLLEELAALAEADRLG